jgi:hypothetical protein
VMDLSTLGHGRPDIAVSFAGGWLMVEIKAPGGRMTPDEIEYQQECWRNGAQYEVARSTEDVLRIIRHAMDAREE